MKIYDWNNVSKNIDVNVPVKSIHVKVLSGDEVVTVNGKKTYDASDSRVENLFDSEYDVTGPAKVERWINFISKRNGVAYAYQRSEKFAHAEGRSSI